MVQVRYQEYRQIFNSHGKMQVQVNILNTVCYYSSFRASNKLSSAGEVGLNLFVFPDMGDGGWVGSRGVELGHLCPQV